MNAYTAALTKIANGQTDLTPEETQAIDGLAIISRDHARRMLHAYAVINEWGQTVARFATMGEAEQYAKTNGGEAYEVLSGSRAQG